MISLMAYAALVAALIGLAALFAERVLAELAWPRRGVWLLALAASVAVPAVSLLGPAPGTEPGNELLPFTIDLLPVIVPPEAGGAVPIPSEASWLTRFDWQLVDNALVAFWVLSCAVILAACAVAGFALRRALRDAQRMAIDGQEVFLSDRLGPAVIGFARPRIVLPRWLADGESSLRALVLDHEREHIAARDQLTLIASLALVACMPWNPALWWQLGRLRAAIEVDCDARVIRNGGDRIRYSEALLFVRQRNARVPFGAVALTEPVSQLEQRIRIMLDKARKISASRVGVASVLALSFVAVACMVQAPLAQQSRDPAQPAQATESPQDEVVMPIVRSVVYDRLNAARDCQAERDIACVEARIAELEALDLNNYETAQLLALEASVAESNGDTAAATAAYEDLLDLEDVPDVLREPAMRRLAVTYAETQQFREAFETLNELLELRGGAPVVAGQSRVDLSTGANPPSLSTSANPPSLSTGEYLPIVRVAPVYPPRAAARGLEGYVVVRYTVTTTGSTRDIEVVESSSTLFERAAIESAARYRYRPRVIDGIPVEVVGVTSRIEFVLDRDSAEAEPNP